MDMNRDDEVKPDRVLGDEWENWSGSLDESITYSEDAWLFTVCSTVAVICMLGSLGIILYLIEPRLFMIHPVLVPIALIITLLLIISVVILTSLILASVYTGKNFLISTRLGQMTASRILPLALAVAQKLGISRDRLGNSFVYFSNAIVKASHKPGTGKTIIIFPRCLKSDLKKEVQDIGKRANIGVFPATGGGQARKVIIKERPSAVIGIACERDLISGIHDIAAWMPTLGVANERPEGPCKNTVVDLDELKKAIETLTGKTLD